MKLKITQSNGFNTDEKHSEFYMFLCLVCKRYMDIKYIFANCAWNAETQQFHVINAVFSKRLVFFPFS